MTTRQHRQAAKLHSRIAGRLNDIAGQSDTPPGLAESLAALAGDFKELGGLHTFAADGGDSRRRDPEADIDQYGSDRRATRPGEIARTCGFAKAADDEFHGLADSPETGL